MLWLSKKRGTMVNCKFLIVESSEMSTRILVDILKSEGYTDICVAHNAVAALDMLGVSGNTVSNCEEKSVDLVITALVMPGINGIELCRRIKGESKLCDIPVLMITASEDSDTQTEAFQAGILDYIMKPFNPVLVLARIKAALKLKEEMEKRRDREKTLEQYNYELVNDLQVAQQLQKHMLPTALVNEEISISGCYLPITFLGGDFYYWNIISDGRYGMILLDVMGHGTATSMICMYLRSILPDLVKTALTAKELVEQLNQIMIDFNEQLSYKEYNCAAFYMIVDTCTQTIEYVNAGAPPAALVEEHQDIRWLDEGCPPLGIFAALPIMSEKIHYDSKARILVYSDGIDELFVDKSLNMEYLLNYLMVYGKAAGDASVIIEKFAGFIEMLPRSDDVSLICLELSGRENCERQEIRVGGRQWKEQG